MIAKKLGLFGALFLLTTGCAGLTVTRSGRQLPPRGEGCAFDVFTTLPSGYTEFGALDISHGSRGVPTDIPDFQEVVAKDVCAMGGDAVLAMMSGGAYTRAAVLQKVAAPVSGAPSSSADGCRYDAQCKGERICVSGQCVDPPAK